MLPFSLPFENQTRPSCGQEGPVTLAWQGIATTQTDSSTAIELATQGIFDVTLYGSIG
jgi:hypothetical protein